jgi:hypothetical protein
MGDSFITNNYINGGAKYHDNVCFGFASMGACTVSNNFVDFYRCMFSPCYGEMNNAEYHLPTCSNNQWEMFRYLIDTRYIYSVFGSFTNEHFNHLNENESPFKEYDAFTSEQGDIPPCLLNIQRATNNCLYQVTFDNLYFDQSCNGFSILAQYAPWSWFNSNKASKIVLNVASMPASWGVEQVVKLPVDNFDWDNNGNGINVNFLDSNITVVLDELPIISGKNFKYIPELKYQIGGNIYKLTPINNDSYAFIGTTPASQIQALIVTTTSGWNEMDLKALFGETHGVYLVAARTDYYTASSGVWIVEMSPVEVVITPLQNVNASLAGDASKCVISFNANYSSPQTYYVSITKLA